MRCPQLRNAEIWKRCWYIETIKTINSCSYEATQWYVAGAQPGGGHLGICPPPEIFKTLHSIFVICRNFQRIKMKVYILLIFKKSYFNFSLSCSLIIISLEDISWDRLSDRKLRNWLVFNHKYAGSVNLGYSLNCSYFKAFFIYLFVYDFVLDRPKFALMKLYNIRVLLNRANCWNFQIDKSNLYIVSASSNRLYFYDLLIIIFVRSKADHHY